MKKVILMISLGICLIIIGSIVTFNELGQWSLYNLQENVADYPIKTIKANINLTEENVDKIHIINYYDNDHHMNRMRYDDDFIEDYLSDIIVNDYYPSHKIEIVEDVNQAEDLISIEYTYAEIFEFEQCYIESVNTNHLNIEQDYSPYRRHSKSKRHNNSNKRPDYTVELDKDNIEIVYPYCNYQMKNMRNKNIFNPYYRTGIKALLKNKQLPFAPGEFKITVNPKDVSKVQY